jgi:hypothetical protein
MYRIWLTVRLSATVARPSKWRPRGISYGRQDLGHHVKSQVESFIPRRRIGGLRWALSRQPTPSLHVSDGVA